jgi:hypothetical protein
MVRLSSLQPFKPTPILPARDHRYEKSRDLKRSRRGAEPAKISVHICHTYSTYPVARIVESWKLDERFRHCRFFCCRCRKEVGFGETRLKLWARDGTALAAASGFLNFSLMWKS